MVVAAVVQGELLALRPFGWGDGVVARAAARLTLDRPGTGPEVAGGARGGASRARGRLSTRLLAGYVTGAPDGVARWVRHCASAVGLGARDALAVCEAFTRSVSYLLLH